MSRFAGEPPFDQMPARQDEFRASIAEALGHTHPGMEGQYVMSDRDMLKAILELRANVSEDARQLQELRRAFAAQRAFLKASGTRFRKEVADALGLIDPDDAMILLWIAGIRADGAENARQLQEGMKERDEARAERAAALAGLEAMTVERDEARAKLAKQIAVAEALANVRQQIERFPAMTVEAKREAAREALQSTASTLRKLATTGGYCPELVNAAAEVESIFDWLYLPKPVDDVAAPKTRRST